MNMFVIGSEIFIRLGFFFGVFGVMAGWEAIAPKRRLRSLKRTRWFNNIALTLLNAGLLRLALPVTAVAAAVYAEENGWGVFNALDAGLLPAGIISVIFLDLAIFAQHLVFHAVPPLWRLHMVHHTDLDIDVTTGARFHPVEILLSGLLKAGLVVVLGAPPWSVVAFEVLLNGTSMFNHANVSMPAGMDRALRLFVVTPDMHRVHHSVIKWETNSNYGFNLPWWDRLFGTYRPQPRDGHKDMVIGLANFREQSRLNLGRMMIIPFVTKREYL